MIGGAFRLLVALHSCKPSKASKSPVEGPYEIRHSVPIMAPTHGSTTVAITVIGACQPFKMGCSYVRIEKHEQFGVTWP